jgi:hypothetical protein
MPRPTAAAVAAVISIALMAQGALVSNRCDSRGEGREREFNRNSNSARLFCNGRHGRPLQTATRFQGGPRARSLTRRSRSSCRRGARYRHSPPSERVCLNLHSVFGEFWTRGGGERDGKKQNDERECSGLAAKPCASSFFARVPSAPRPFYVLAPKKVSAFSGSALALHLCSRGKGPSQAVVGAVGGKRRFGLSTRANRCFVFLLGTALSLSSSLLSLPLLSLLLFSLFFSLSR